MKKMFLLLACVTLTLIAGAQTSDIDTPDLYITGTFTGWGLAGDPDGKSIKMDLGENYTYTATIYIENNPYDRPRFQINRFHEWHTYGTPDTAPLTETSSDVQLLSPGSSNIFLDVDDGSYLVTLKLIEQTLSITPTHDPIHPFPPIYITASFNSWYQPHSLGTIKMAPDENGVYTATANIYNTTTQPTRFLMGSYKNCTYFGARKGSGPFSAYASDIEIVSQENANKGDILLDVENGSYIITFDKPNMRLSITPIISDIPQSQAATFTGDSICDFWDRFDPLLFAQNRILNTGVSGDTSTQILYRFNTCTLLDFTPIIVIISPSTNDIAQIQGPMTHDQMIDNVRRMIAKAKAQTPPDGISGDVKVVITSNLPCKSFPAKPSVNAVQEISEVNNLLKDLAAETGCEYIDLFTPFADAEGGLPTKYSGDGVHPNAAGYEIMKNAIMPVVEKLRNEISTGANHIPAVAPSAPAQYYNLQGQPITHPTPGNIYIMVKGHTATKVIL